MSRQRAASGVGSDNGVRGGRVCRVVRVCLFFSFLFLFFFFALRLASIDGRGAEMAGSADERGGREERVLRG